MDNIGAPSDALIPTENASKHMQKKEHWQLKCNIIYVISPTLQAMSCQSSMISSPAVPTGKVHPLYKRGKVSPFHHHHQYHNISVCRPLKNTKVPIVSSDAR